MTRNGFTLIEMLVALSLFAIAALALARLDAFAISTTADLRDNSLARLVVGNEAALLQSDALPLAIGSSTETRSNGGRQFSVTRSVSRTPDPRLVRVDIRAVPAGGGAPASITLVTRNER